MADNQTLMPEEEGIPNTRGSCTLEEAVARLLGWLQSPISKRYIPVSEHGVSVDQLPLMSRLPDSLDQTLSEIRAAAQAALLDAAEANAEHEILASREEAVFAADRLIELARRYRMDIEDAAFAPDSQFVINPVETERTGVPHYTLRSLDKWARDTYGIPLIEGAGATRIDPKAETAEQPVEDVSPSDDVPSRKRWQSFKVTMGLLIEDLYPRAKAYQRSPDVNILGLATALHKIAKKLDPDTPGQGVESIRDRLKEAWEAKYRWKDGE